MSYNYGSQKAALFTEDGAEILLAVRDEALRLLAEAGAFTCGKATRNAMGDAWTALAALDYLIERGELRRVTPVGTVHGQDEVFVAGRA